MSTRETWNIKLYLYKGWARPYHQNTLLLSAATERKHSYQLNELMAADSKKVPDQGVPD